MILAAATGLVVITTEPGGWATGKDIFASLHVRFEIGL